MFIPILGTVIMPLPEISGPIALGIIAIYGIFQFIKWLVSVIKKPDAKENPMQKQIDELKTACQESNKILQNLKEQQSVFMAHYQSEERVKANMEKRIEIIEQRLFSGNGRDSIETQLALLKQKVEHLENGKPKRSTRTTK